MNTAAERTAAAYGRCAPGYDRQVPYFAMMGERLVELVGPSPGERVLDVASGRGACLSPAAERVGPTGHVHGVDLAEGMVGRLSTEIVAKGLTHASVERADATDLTVAPGSHDVLTCSHALFFLEEPERAVRGFLRALRPGGRLGISVPASQLLPGDSATVGAIFASHAARAGLSRARAPAFGMDTGSLLTGAGAVDVHVTDEERTFVFEGIEAWWEWTWTVGTRALYEALSEEGLRRLREELFEALEPALTPQGLPARARCRFATAVRP